MEHPIIIYTDGSSLGNPGPGGLGVVLRHGTRTKEYSEGYQYTTNNRMELLAVIRALELIRRPELPIILHSDSQYVINAITKRWVHAWAQKPNFGGKKNMDLWKRYLALEGKFNIQFKWVKGHAGIADNERCDQLATAAAARPDRKDIEFELSTGL